MIENVAWHQCIILPVEIPPVDYTKSSQFSCIPNNKLLPGVYHYRTQHRSIDFRRRGATSAVGEARLISTSSLPSGRARFGGPRNSSWCAARKPAGSFVPPPQSEDSLALTGLLLTGGRERRKQTSVLLLDTSPVLYNVGGRWCTPSN